MDKPIEMSLEEFTKIGKRLDDYQAQLSALTKENEAGSCLILQLRSQLSTLQKDFDRMRKLNEHHKNEFLRVNAEAGRIREENEELRGLFKKILDESFEGHNEKCFHCAEINELVDNYIQAKKALEKEGVG